MRIGAHRVGHYSEMLRCRLTYRHRRGRRWEKARTAGSPFFRTSTLRRRRRRPPRPTRGRSYELMPAANATERPGRAATAQRNEGGIPQQTV